MNNFSLPDYLHQEGLVHSSIIDHLFQKNKKDSYFSRYSNEYFYPNNAEALIKLSSILIQAYILSDLVERDLSVDSAISCPKLKASLKDFWLHKQTGTLNSHMTIITQLKDTEYGHLINSEHIDVLKDWSEIFKRQSKSYRGEKTILSEEFSLFEMLTKLLKYLKILSEVNIDLKNNQLSFSKNPQKRIPLSPFLISKKVQHYNPEYLLVPINMIIDKDTCILSIVYSDPTGEEFSIDEAKNQVNYRFNSKSKESTLLKKILIALGAELPIKSVSVSGSFEHLQKIVNLTHGIFSSIYLSSDKSSLSPSEERVCSQLLHFLKFGNSHLDEEFNFKGDQRDLYDHFWMILVQVGIYNFMKRFIAYIKLSKFIDIAYTQHFIELNQNDFMSRLEKLKTDRLSEIITVFPKETKYYRDRVQFLEESAPILLILEDLGLQKDILITDYTELTSIDDYLDFIDYEKSFSALSISEKVIKFLYCFYSGVLAYATHLESKNHLRQTFEALDLEADEAMLKAAEKAYQEIEMLNPTISIATLVSKLIDVIEELDKRKYSYDVFGRKSFADIKGLKSYYSFNEKRNAVAHPDKQGNISGSSDLLQALNALKSFLIFLKTGNHVESFEAYMTSNDNDLTLCVYPQVVSFKETITKRNSITYTGYETYRTPYGSDTKEERKLILTSQKINEFKEYYCIPNSLRTTEDIMVEPFLIACEDFDARVPIHKSKQKKTGSK